MFLLLTTVWLLLIKPEGDLPAAQLSEFSVDQVEFSSQADCEVYARLYAQKYVKEKRGAAVKATYTCVSRDG